MPNSWKKTWILAKLAPPCILAETRPSFSPRLFDGSSLQCPRRSWSMLSWCIPYNPIGLRNTSEHLSCRSSVYDGLPDHSVRVYGIQKSNCLTSHASVSRRVLHRAFLSVLNLLKTISFDKIHRLVARSDVAKMYKFMILQLFYGFFHKPFSAFHDIHIAGTWHLCQQLAPIGTTWQALQGRILCLGESWLEKALKQICMTSKHCQVIVVWSLVSWSWWILQSIGSKVAASTRQRTSTLGWHVALLILMIVLCEATPSSNGVNGDSSIPNLCHK